MSRYPETVIRELLPNSWSQTRRNGLTDQILDALYDAGLLIDGSPRTVEVRGARVAVEAVEAYGLRISLDANGNAVEIASPWGLEVTA